MGAARYTRDAPNSDNPRGREHPSLRQQAHRSPAPAGTTARGQSKIRPSRKQPTATPRGAGPAPAAPSRTAGTSARNATSKNRRRGCRRIRLVNADGEPSTAGAWTRAAAPGPARAGMARGIKRMLDGESFFINTFTTGETGARRTWPPGPRQQPQPSRKNASRTKSRITSKPSPSLQKTRTATTG